LSDLGCQTWHIEQISLLNIFPGLPQKRANQSKVFKFLINLNFCEYIFL
jgi:hypothetical protein